MPRTYLILGDIEGKLDVLRIGCTKCRRKGRYSVRKLIEKYGRKAKGRPESNQERDYFSVGRAEKLTGIKHRNHFLNLVLRQLDSGCPETRACTH